MFRAFLIVLACAFVFIAPPAAAAKKSGNASAVLDEDWQKTFALMQDQKNPIAAKLLTWIYVTETNLPIEAHELMRFVNENPNWPGLHQFRKKIEENIADSGVPDAEMTLWFRQNPPKTYDGAKTALDALLKTGQTDAAKNTLARFWRNAKLNRNETATMAARYKKLFRPDAHAARLDALIWAGRLKEAKYMLAFTDPDTRALGQARIALTKLSRKGPALLKTVPPSLQNNEGLLYARALWRRRKNMNDGALEMIERAAKAPLSQPEKWWRERNILARRATEDKNFQRAYDITAAHGLTPGSVDFAEAEWLTGWLALRFLNKPEDALKRFDGMYYHVNSAISRGRAAYWAGRAAEDMKQNNLSQLWYRLGGLFISTYYGQLAYHKAHNTTPLPRMMEEPQAMPEHVTQFNQDERVAVIRLLKQIKLEKLTDSFFARLIKDAKIRDDFLLIAQLATEIGRPYYTVQANKSLQTHFSLYLPHAGYPLLAHTLPRNADRSLAHAITYRESMFQEDIISPAGARGLMQLMPATAKSLSRQLRKRYSRRKLTNNPAYNVQLGTTYLISLSDDYNGFYPYAIAAYNAGPGNVKSWVKLFGDPRAGDIDLIDWIELVPFYETRNYIQRVMETMYMYDLRFQKTPRLVTQFINEK
ncbi:MAG: transglycosylase SLT domain-containing protein [Alphaproteobacteria bacterium]|nr:transglycosylase SLT domain-containing protein [Alphaproteobacteria bacterium]